MKHPRTKLSTDISLKPKGSQVFLLAFLLIGGIALLVGFYFLWHRPDVAWIPVLIGLFCLIASFFGWAQSQHQVDLETPLETSISSSHSELRLVTDSRALSSQQAIQGLADLFSMIGNRHPLPDPDGLVDSTGSPVPGSKANADQRVSTANREARDLLEKAGATLSRSKDSDLAMQPSVIKHASQQRDE